MSHRLYTTEGLVITREESGEGSSLLWLLTPDLGLIRARAQGLRELKSKLRYSLQLFNLAEVSLVRGRETWRLVNAHPEPGYFSAGPASALLPLVARINRLVYRLVRGEEANPELFNELKSGLAFLMKSELNPEQVKVAEILLVLRLLETLGYIEARVELKPALEFQSWSENELRSGASVQASALGVINQALRHSHL